MVAFISYSYDSSMLITAVQPDKEDFLGPGMQDRCFVLEKMVSGRPGPRTTFSSSQKRLVLFWWANNLNKTREHLKNAWGRGLPTSILSTMDSYHVLVFEISKLIDINHKYMWEFYPNVTKPSIFSPLIYFFPVPLGVKIKPYMII